ncbi:MAG: dihydroorotase [Desulfonatronovibrionaceae bacterium]
MSTVFLRNIIYFGQSGDLLLEDSWIREFFPEHGSGTADSEVPGDGFLVVPSLIDGHVHFREPGQEYKEDISSGLYTAAGGGFGHVLCMANTNPINDTAPVTRFMLQRAKEAFPGGPFLYPVGALTKGLKGAELAPMAELADAGCLAFSNDGLPVVDASILRHGLEYASDLGCRVIDHCQDPALSGEGCVNEGALSALLGLPGDPVLSESVQVARDILLAQYLDIPVHLAHISCRQSVELIAWAKEKSIPVTAETCPHYLFLTEEDVRAYNTYAKVNPPLRTSDDVLALRQAVRTGVIDCIVTDHAPHAELEKDQPFSSALNGISGLDTCFSLLYSLLPDTLSFSDLLRLCLKKPAEIYSIKASMLNPGESADFFLFDPGAKWKVDRESMLSRGKNTPFLNTELTGRIVAHYIRGRPVFSRN